MKLRLIFAVQRVIATLAAAFPARRSISWVVGVDEVASMLTSMARELPGAVSACVGGHLFYSFDYDIPIAIRGGRLRRALSVYFRAPWVLGRLARRASGFVYLGSAGFLLTGVDQRRFEFGLLRAHGVRIVCVFLGDDIRAPRLMHELERQMGRLNASTNAGLAAAVMETDEYDQSKRDIAAVADDLADLIFSTTVDQASYLRSPVEPYMYFFPDAEVDTPRPEPSPDERLIVLHAPSNPAIKGTPDVHRAVAALRDEGFDFDYRELIGVPNAQVREAVRSAHIVLNQFYTFVPGVFGVEALAAGAAVLMSADERLEPSLPPGSHLAWLVTRPDQVTDHLRSLLTDRAAIAGYSERAVDWVRSNAVNSVTGPRLRKRLDALLRDS